MAPIIQPSPPPGKNSRTRRLECGCVDLGVSVDVPRKGSCSFRDSNSEQSSLQPNHYSDYVTPVPVVHILTTVTQDQYWCTALTWYCVHAVPGWYLLAEGPRWRRWSGGDSGHWRDVGQLLSIGGSGGGISGSRSGTSRRACSRIVQVS